MKLRTRLRIWLSSVKLGDVILTGLSVLFGAALVIVVLLLVHIVHHSAQQDARLRDATSSQMVLLADQKATAQGLAKANQRLRRAGKPIVSVPKIRAISPPSILERTVIEAISPTAFANYCLAHAQCRGPAGATGSAGISGVDGGSGPPGTEGDAGPAGPVGPAGPAGADGKNGTDGAPGKDGSNGSDGAPGRGITSAECTGLGDTLIFTYSDGSTQTVTCTLGAPTAP